MSGFAPTRDLGQTVVLRTMQGEVYGIGRVISYTDRPSVCVEYADGSRDSWLAELTQPTTCGLLCCPAMPPHRPSDPTCVSMPLLWNGDNA